MGRLWLTGWKNMRWMTCLLLEGAATGLGKRTSEPHPDARNHAILAPSSRQGVGWSRTGASSSNAAPDVAIDRAANPGAAVPSSRQEGGDQGGSAKAVLPLAEAAPPRQSLTVLQPLRWGDCRPGTAKAPATRASPDDPPRRRHHAGSFSSSSPKYRGPPSLHQPWFSSRSRDWTGGLTSVQHPFSEHSRRGGGAAKLPRTEPSGGHWRRGTDVEQGREMGRDHAVPCEGCISGFDPGWALDYEVTLG